MEVEAKELRDQMTQHWSFDDDFRRFDVGMLGATPAALIVTGPGKVNAAMTVQSALTHFLITQVVFSGVGGGLGDTAIGDIVVSWDACYHDYGTWGAQGVSRFDVTIKFPPNHSRVRVDRFYADPQLVEIVASIAQSMVWPPLPFATRSPQVHVGTIATGDQFIASESKGNAVAASTGALSVDMETAAMAQVATLNETPFVAVRTVSDRADEPAGIDFEKFVHAAARRSAVLISDVLRQVGRIPIKDTLVLTDGVRVVPRPTLMRIECDDEARAKIEAITGQIVESLDVSALDVRRVVCPSSGRS